jgi:hypothetical protein
MKLAAPRKILSLPPFNPVVNPCGVNLYAPNVIPGEALYCMGGHIDKGNDRALDSDKHFADRIFRSEAMRSVADPPSPGVTPSGTVVQWGPPVEIIGHSFWPWMHDTAWLSQHLESYIGSCGSPSVVKLAPDRYVMAFTASVNDVNVWTAEHADRDNFYGSGVKPWSFDVMYWATSTDGKTWKLAPPFPPRIPASVDREQWRALNWSALWYYPEPYDRILGPNNDKGNTAVDLLLDDDGYFKLLLGLWSTGGMKQCLARVKYVPDSAAGHYFDFEIYDTYSKVWIACREGRIPSQFDVEPWPFGTLSGAQCQSIALSPKLGSKYAGCFNMGGGRLGIGLTADLTQWPTLSVIDGTVSGMLNPAYDENQGVPNIKFGMQDPACVAIDAYAGISLWQADIQL